MLCSAMQLIAVTWRYNNPLDNQNLTRWYEAWTARLATTGIIHFSRCLHALVLSSYRIHFDAWIIAKSNALCGSSNAAVVAVTCSALVASFYARGESADDSEFRAMPAAIHVSLENTGLVSLLVCCLTAHQHYLGYSTKSSWDRTFEICWKRFVIEK